MTTKIQKIIFSLLAIISAILAYFYQQIKTYQSHEGKFLVTQVLDGDSFVISPDQTIRLANIDAPELNLCFGKQAKDYLENLILNKYVDIKVCGRDAYKRTVATVYLSDNELVNESIAENGYAIYTSTKTEERQVINQAIEKARQNSLGIFSSTCSQMENNNKPKCNIKGNIGKHDRVKYYHLPECSEYNRTIVELHLGEEWFCTENEAQKAGYTKSKNCP